MVPQSISVLISAASQASKEINLLGFF